MVRAYGIPNISSLVKAFSCYSCFKTPDTSPSTHCVSVPLLYEVLIAEKDCPQSCEIPEYTASVMSTRLDTPGMCAIVLSYPTVKALFKSEYYVYTIGGIIGAVGGSLGMFLGFSFWQMGGDLITRMKRYKAL